MPGAGRAPEPPGPGGPRHHRPAPGPPGPGRVRPGPRPSGTGPRPSGPGLRRRPAPRRPALAPGRGLDRPWPSALSGPRPSSGARPSVPAPGRPSRRPAVALTGPGLLRCPARGRRPAPGRPARPPAVRPWRPAVALTGPGLRRCPVDGRRPALGRPAPASSGPGPSSAIGRFGPRHRPALGCPVRPPAVVRPSPVAPGRVRLYARLSAVPGRPDRASGGRRPSVRPSCGARPSAPKRDPAVRVTAAGVRGRPGPRTCGRSSAGPAAGAVSGTRLSGDGRGSSWWCRRGRTRGRRRARRPRRWCRVRGDG